MDSMLVQYGLFILAAFILIGIVIALNKRLSRQNRPGPDVLTTWAKLDPRRSTARGNRSPTLEEEEEEGEAELHARARQNGHHAESQKPQM